MRTRFLQALVLILPVAPFIGALSQSSALAPQRPQAALRSVVLSENVEPSEFSIGSLIVALRTRDAIILAADSREVRIDPAGRAHGTRDDKCKMFEQGGVVFALAGIAQSSASFDAMALGRRVIDRGLSLKATAAEFQRLARPALQHELRRWSPAPGETPAGIPGLHYVFAKPEGGVSAAVWGGLAGFRDADGAIIVGTIDEGLWPGTKENVVMFGKSAAVMREARKGPIGFRTEAEASLVAQEMMRIAAADPQDGRFVGGPTDVAIVRPAGISWSKRKSQCSGR